MAETPEQTRIRLKAKAARIRAEKERQTGAQAALMTMPDEFTGEMSQEDIEKAKVVYPGVGREFLEGLTFGGSGEIAGAYEGAKAALSGEEFSPAFKSGMERYEAKRTGFKEQYPGLALASEVTGSLPLGLFSAARTAAAKTLAPKLLAPMAGGATYGFLGTEGDLEQRGIGSGIGAGLGLTLGTVGALLPKGKTEAAKQLMRETDIPLTVGQQMGGSVQALEDVLSKSLLGRITGATSAKQKAYEAFNKDFIQKAVSPLGVKIPKDMNVKEASKWAEKTIKKRFSDAVESSSVPDASQVLDTLERAIKPKSINNIELNLDDIKMVQTELQKAVASNIFENKMTGQMAQKSLKALNTASKKADLPDNVKQVIKGVKEELEGVLVSQNPRNKELINARKAYANMFPMRKATKKVREDVDVTPAFSPSEAAKALESAKTPASSSLYQAVERAAVPLSGLPPKATGIANVTDIGALATAMANPSSLAYLLAAPLMYRTGRTGAALGRSLLSAPARTADIASMPVITGNIGSLLAEQ